MQASLHLEMLRSWDFLDHGDERITPILRHPEQGPVNSSLRDITLCHPELVSESSHRKTLGSTQKEKVVTSSMSQMLNQVQHDKKKKAAFTLAEVLITLGIIGVVAAMTLPTVISNYKKSEVTNKLKVVYSLLNQAYKLSTIDNGYISEWQIPSSAKEYTEKYWLPYFSGATICLTPAECGYKSNTPFYQADGTPHSTLIDNDSYRFPLKLKNGIYVFFSIAKGAGPNNRSSLIIVDINGSNLPNKFGYDVFKLIVTDNVVSGAYSDYDVTTQKEQCASIGSNCFNLIHNNNWEIPKDYPIKF